jgi:hypothetical protein
LSRIRVGRRVVDRRVFRLRVRSAVLVEEVAGVAVPVGQGELLSGGADVLVGELGGDVEAGMAGRFLVALAGLPAEEEPVVDVVAHAAGIGVGGRVLKCESIGGER